MQLKLQEQKNPKSVLAVFLNEYNQRIVVPVDMIAEDTDVKPLECLLFMRDVNSPNYFEQMKGWGIRTLGFDDLKKVIPSASASRAYGNPNATILQLAVLYQELIYKVSPL
jgi:type I restriction enzyme R subunit